MTEQEKIAIAKYDLMFESRLTRTESTMDNIDRHIQELKSYFRWMLGIMIGGFSVVICSMAKGFHWF